MVSKASEDLPEPESPVITVSVSRGISTSIFFRLCSRAPRMEMFFSMEFPKWRNANFGLPAWAPQPRNRHIRGASAHRSLQHVCSRVLLDGDFLLESQEP